jgi:dihydrofolate synthase / folylpolyglutamate synthase
MKLAEAEAFLEGLINLERSPDPRRVRLSLAPIRALLARLDHPQRGLRILHVAGSKGKGSIVLLAETLAREAGLRVGAFTSPHLSRWTERFRLDGREVEGGRLAHAVARLRPHVEALRGGCEMPSFFDATTAAALLLFADARVDLAVLEVGLGGRLDSTNAVDPAVCCVASIELEHTEKLGHTLAAIAREKAGIIKTGVPLVMGPLPEEAAAEVEARAREEGAPLSAFGRDFHADVLDEGLEGSRARLRDAELDVEVMLPCLGVHQVTNAALALACVRRLSVASAEALPAIARRAFAGARLPGRVEVVSRSPFVVIDSAHTAASARALARVLARIPRLRSHLVLSVSAGKDLRALCAALAPQADTVTVTRADPIRSLTPQEVAAAVRALAPAAEVRIVPNPHLALRAARAALAPADLLCATGSVYLAGIARQVLGPQPDAH